MYIEKLTHTTAEMLEVMMETYVEKISDLKEHADILLKDNDVVLVDLAGVEYQASVLYCFSCEAFAPLIDSMYGVPVKDIDVRGLLISALQEVMNVSVNIFIEDEQLIKEYEKFTITPPEFYAISEANSLQLMPGFCSHAKLQLKEGVLALYINIRKKNEYIEKVGD